jgi:hypothetical protein
MRSDNELGSTFFLFFLVSIAYLGVHEQRNNSRCNRLTVDVDVLDIACAPCVSDVIPSVSAHGTWIAKIVA